MKTYLLTFLLFWLGSTAAFAASGEPIGSSIFDHWSQRDLNEITLYLDFAEVESNRRTENRMEGRIFDGEQEYDLTYEVRGRFRRNTCALPPLKLHLNKKGLTQFGFNKHNDFKLVTHCTDDEAGQDALLREELAYELYRQLFPEAAFRTRLVKVNYVDTKTDVTINSYGILIEDVDELAQRLSAEGCGSDGCFNLPVASIDNAAEVSLFQYMIGNADYSLIMQRNVKLLKKTNGQFTAVPYDFDFSGLVNTAYAVADPHLGQQKITDRVWLWQYDADPKLKEVRTTFLEKKDQLLDTVAEFPGLSDDSKKEISRYLKHFFSEVKHSPSDIVSAR